MHEVSKGNQWLLDIKQRQLAQDCYETEFWSKVKIDISCNMDNEIPGWSKMQGNAETVDKMQQHLAKNMDFALTNDDGGYVYVLNNFMVVCYHPKKPEQNALINIKPEAFINSMKLILLGHPLFVPNNALQFNKFYKKYIAQ